MATLNSPAFGATPRPLLWFTSLCLVVSSSQAAEPVTNSAPLVEIAERTLISARARLATNLNDTAWQCARALFDRAEFSTNHTERATLANEGIALCRRLVAAQPENIGGHFYLGLNLGQLARTKLFGALPLVDEMEGAFLKSRALDEKFAFAGPDRYLGLLYLEAPGWPVSVGSRAKAHKHLTRAVELAPDFPENRLNLLEALLRWNETKAADEQRASLALLLPRARKQFAGDAWAANRANWENRWRALGPPPAPPCSDR
jgi:tetratricopeptide (TPR) repeat protein